MATRPIITNQGQALLASSSQSTGQNYWLGYYLLSYVPNIWKTDASIAFPNPQCGNVGSGTEIQTTDTDNVVPSMTRITKYGDVIYNIWQGDVVGTGYGYEGSDGTAGGELFGMSYYDTSIKKHYRYVLDENGVNNLVAWSDDINDLMLGKTAYVGTDGYYQSAIPIPASLYYLPSTNGPHISVADYFPDFNDEENNGSSIYPYIDVSYKLNSGSTALPITVPKVSTDYRAYTDSLGGSSTPSTGGAYFNAVEIPYPTATGYDETSWFSASKTQMVDYEELTGFSTICREMWKLHTISNYNRFHAPVNEVGQVMNSDISSRNMSTLTKYFPISNYKVINSERGVRDNGATVEVATALAITIDIDLAPKVLAPGYSTDGTYDEQGNLSFFDSYNNPSNPSTPYDQNGNSIFNTTHTSFKFNRIGIYAVAMRQSPFVADGVDENGVNKVQFEINPDAEPILFAVVDWDNTVTLDDSGNGIHQFRAELNVNLESSDGSADPTPLLRDATIFYNLYQDDALTWYQNQLIANASISNAVTELALEVASIKKNSKSSQCCAGKDTSDEYALKNHSHAMLRNLLDANNAFDGGLKGVDTFKEGALFEAVPYKLGKDSIALGKGTIAAGDYSSSNGENNYIKSTAGHSSINGGSGSSISYAQNVDISGGSDNDVQYATNSSINGSKASLIHGDNTSDTGNGNGYADSDGYTINGANISGGTGHKIMGNVDYAGIFAGEGHEVSGNAVKSVIIGGATGKIHGDSDLSSIVGGVFGEIVGISRFSGLFVGCQNSIGTNLDPHHVELGTVIIGGINCHINGYFPADYGVNPNSIIASNTAYIDNGNGVNITGSVGVSMKDSYTSSVISCNGKNAVNTGSVHDIYNSHNASLIDSAGSFIYTGNRCTISSSSGSSIIGDYVYASFDMAGGVSTAYDEITLNTADMSHFAMDAWVMFIDIPTPAGDPLNTFIVSTPQIVMGTVYKISAYNISTNVIKISTLDGTLININTAGNGMCKIYNMTTVPQSSYNGSITSSQGSSIIGGATQSIQSANGCYIKNSLDTSILSGGGSGVTYAKQSSILTGGGHNIIGSMIGANYSVKNSAIIAGQNSFIAPLRGDITSIIDGAVVLTGNYVHARHDGEVVQGASNWFSDGGEPIVGGSQVSRIVQCAELGTDVNTFSYIEIMYIDAIPNALLSGKLTLTAYGSDELTTPKIGNSITDCYVSIIGDSITFTSKPDTAGGYSPAHINDANYIVHDVALGGPGIRLEHIYGPSYSDNGYVLPAIHNRISIQICKTKSYRTKFIAVFDYTQIRWNGDGYTTDVGTDFMGTPIKLDGNEIRPIVNN